VVPFLKDVPDLNSSLLTAALPIKIIASTPMENLNVRNTGERQICWVLNVN
jgi:hypothetical protein